MKKILLISYFYPPANFVGVQLTAAWAKYLHEYGYYPIIITRQWNEGQTDLADQLKNSVLKIGVMNSSRKQTQIYIYV